MVLYNILNLYLDLPTMNNVAFWLALGVKGRHSRGRSRYLKHGPTLELAAALVPFFL